MHVGITRELLNSVSNKINHDLKPKDYRLNFGVDDIDDTFKLPADHPILPKIIWRDLCHLRELMPADWCDKLETHYHGKRTLGFTTKVKGQEYPVSVIVNITGKQDVILPPKTGTYRPEFEVKHDTYPELKEFFNKRLEEMAFEKKWQKVVEDVRSFLESNKSLNAALKAWPELRAFIPAEYLERVDRKVERKAQQEEVERKLAEIDREGAVAAAALAALAA